MKDVVHRALAWALAGTALLVSGCGRPPSESPEPMGVLPTAVTTAEPLWIPFSIRAGQSMEPDPREGHLRRVRRLTVTGRAVGAAWYPDGRAVLVEQHDEKGCGRLVKLSLGDGTEAQVSPEGGCASRPWIRGDGEVLFAWGTKGSCGPARLGREVTGADCDVVAMQAGKVVELATGPKLALEPAPGRGGFTFFTVREGTDFELFSLSPEGQRKRLTNAYGYDGGVTVSPDGTKLAWHAARPQVPRRPPAPTAEQGRAGAEPPPPSSTPPRPPAPRRPASLSIFVSGIDGQHARALPTWGTFAGEPTFLVDSRRIVFSSDYDGSGPGETDLYLVEPDGPATAAGYPPIERLTYGRGYDGAPRVSPGGRQLLFVSGRGATADGEVDVYVATLWDGAVTND